MKKLVSNSRGSVWLSFCRRKCGWALQCFCLGKSLAFIQIFSFYASHYKQFWEYELQGKTMKAQMENKSPISVLFLQGSFHSPIVSCLFLFLTSADASTKMHSASHLLNFPLKELFMMIIGVAQLQNFIIEEFSVAPDE